MPQKVSRRRRLAPILATAFLAAATAAPAAEPSESRMGAAAATPATEGLMGAYLDCERDAQAGHLAEADAGACSLIYEELKAQAFDGSYEALRRWYELHRDPGSGHGA